MTTQIEKATSSLKSNISRLMVVLQVFTAAIVLVTIFYIYQFTVLASAANTCRISLETVTLRIDANQILEYAQTGERGEGYEELYNYISDIRTINNFNALFIMIENGDKYQYIIEGGLNRDQSTVSKKFGQQDYKYLFRPEVQKCFDEGTAMSSGAYNSAQSDDVVLAVAPIKDARGRVVAVLYADILKGTILNSHRADLFGILPTVAVIVVVTCILVVVLLTMYAQRRIIAPLRDVTRLSAGLSSGNINVEIPEGLLRRKDEIGVLSRSFAKMVESMLALTGELEPLIETALQEDFSKRADENRLNGVFKEVLEKLNRLLDVVVNKVLFYETLLDAVPMPVSAITTDKNWFYMNKSAKTHFANKGEDPVGSSCALPGSPLCGGEDCMIDQLEKDGLDHIVAPDFEVNGQIYKMHAARVYDKNEKLSCYLEIAEDVTADVRVEEYQEAEIQKISEELAKLAAGDFDLHFEQTKETDVYIQRIRENYDLIKTYIMQTVNSFNTYVSDISEKLTAMANGDLDQEITLDYCGDFKVVKDSLNEILTKFNDMINEINSSADQVSGASRSVSAGSHSLAQATSEQVAASQQIKTTVDLVAGKAKENAHNARKASNLVENAKETSLVGAGKMKGMISAMTEINQASGSISKIIKTIEDIAFQTNILALNAAVEAARAGQSGKGFAVVASEVRNLASKSARAAQDTTTLIESTVKKTAKGVNIAGEAAEAFDKILETILEASDIVNGISEATNEQAISIGQISQGAEHISVSAYTNSATAEESASASEEMYTQADSLKEMIKLFKLRPRENDQPQATFSLQEEWPEFKAVPDKSEEDENEEYDDSKFDFKDGDYNKF